ncbi:corA-like protein [Blautia sp. CAG:257]|nr:corA-like protein [Blautia sp. CAG:257]
MYFLMYEIQIFSNCKFPVNEKSYELTKNRSQLIMYTVFLYMRDFQTRWSGWKKESGKGKRIVIRMFRTSEGAIHEIQEPQDGCWIALTNPTATEIFEISEQFQIEVDDLRAPLDEEERSRIEVEDDYTLILVDVPMIEERNDKDWYGTIPLGIIVTDKMIFTICLEDTQVLTRFMEGRVRNFFTYMKTRFILQILYRNASMYLRYLRIIDKKSEQVEEKLHLSPRNQELIELLELEKSLVYFTTSLRSNEAVLEKLIKVESIKKYPEDTELLEDVIIENTQAIEMANIYRGILRSMMDAFASVISNNLNDVMKILSVITIVMSIPTIIFSAYGMNLNAAGMPFSGTQWGFLIVILISIALSVIAAIVLSKKKYF